MGFSDCVHSPRIRPLVGLGWGSAHTHMLFLGRNIRWSGGLGEHEQARALQIASLFYLVFVYKNETKGYPQTKDTPSCLFAQNSGGSGR